MVSQESQEKEALRSAKEKSALDTKKRNKKNKRNVIRQAIKKAIIAFAIKAGILLVSMILVFAIVGFITNLFGGGGARAYNGMIGLSGLNSENIGYEFTKTHENYPVWQYVNGKTEYNSFIANWITEDKEKYICNAVEEGKIKCFGFGVCHTTDWGRTLLHVEQYKEHGIDISKYMNPGSTLDVDIVDAVGLAIFNSHRKGIEAYAESIGLSLEPYQVDALADIRYHGFGDLYKRICDKYKELGEASEELKNSFDIFRGNTENNQERGEARWKLFSEGIYMIPGGEILDPNDYIVEGDFLEVAEALWVEVCTSGKYTKYGGSMIPAPGPTMDCSAFVSWVLYEYGYEDFKGWQHNTERLYNDNYNELYGWTEIYTEAGQDMTTILRPGDIFVRHNSVSKHVTLVVKIENGRLYSYDCGNTSANWNGTDGSPADKTYFITGNYKNTKGKIIRVTPPQN